MLSVSCGGGKSLHCMANAPMSANVPMLAIPRGQSLDSPSLDVSHHQIKSNQIPLEIPDLVLGGLA